MHQNSAAQDFVRLAFVVSSYPSRQAGRQDLAAGGPKTRKGGNIFKIQYWMYVATGVQTWNGGAPISTEGPGTTGPPLATALHHGQPGPVFFFADTFRSFVPYNSIKTRHNSIHLPTFSDIMTDLT